MANFIPLDIQAPGANAAAFGADLRDALRVGDADVVDSGVLDGLVVDIDGEMKRRPAREVRISDFCRGDGSNERTALLAAIAYAQANNLELVFDKIVAFSGGNITLTNRLLWRGGWGGGLKALQATTVYVRGDRSLVQELDLDWSGFGGTPLFVQSRLTEIIRNYVHDGDGHGIAFDGQNASYPCQYSAAIRNIVKNIGDIGIATNGAIGLRIQQNQLEAIGLEAITLDNDTGTDRGWHVVSGNVADDICKTGGIGAIGMDTVMRCVVSDNQLRRSRTKPGICLQNNTGDTTYNIITENVIYDCNGHGILLFGNSSGYRARNNIITKNNISGYVGDPISVADIETTYNYIEHTYDDAGPTHLGGIGAWAPLIIDKPKFLSGLKATQISATEARLQASGGAASVNASLAGKGPDGRVYLVADGLTALRVLPVANAVNFIDISGDVTGGSGVTVQAGGPDADIPLKLWAKGSAPVKVVGNGFTYNGVQVVDISSVQTLTNKKLTDASTTIIDDADNTKVGKFELSGVASGATRMLTWPNASGTIMTRENAETISGAKTFSANILVDTATGIDGPRIDLRRDGVWIAGIACRTYDDNLLELRGPNADKTAAVVAYTHDPVDGASWWQNGTRRIWLGASGDFYPTVNGTQKLGTASFRWSEVFAATGTINTSDARTKTWDGALSDEELRVASRLRALIGKFRWNDAVEAKGENARRHVGLLAQDVAAAFEAEGFDAGDYGMWCEDEIIDIIEYDETIDINEVVANEDGTETIITRQETVSKVRREPAMDADGTPVTRMGLRYDQVLIFLSAALDAQLTDLEARMADLEGLVH